MDRKQLQRNLFKLGQVLFAIAFIFMGVYGLSLTETAMIESKRTFEFVTFSQIEASTYRYIVYLRSCLFVACGGLVFSDLRAAAYLLLGLLTFCVVFICNPLAERKDFEKAMNWSLLIKAVAAMGGGVLLLLTKGKIQSEGKKIKIGDSQSSKRRFY